MRQVSHIHDNMKEDALSCEVPPPFPFARTRAYTYLFCHYSRVTNCQFLRPTRSPVEYAILSLRGRTSGRGKVRESGEEGKMSEKEWGLRKGKRGRDERF